MNLSPEAMEAFKQDVLARYPEEACGLVVNDRYVPCPNVAERPTETFRIDPVELIKHGYGSIQAILHSHPYDLARPTIYPPEWPSSHDLRAWMGGSIPWGIAATDGEGLTNLVWLDDTSPEPLVGREFVFGVNDCYSLIRDWYRMERGITIPNYVRSMDWWERGEDLYTDNFESAGFYEVPLDEIQVGDVLMFKVRAPVPNHAAVMTGTNEILHHLFHRPSGYDTLAKWARVIVKAVRYRGT